MKIRLFVLVAIICLLPAMATATPEPVSTLEFVEQALSVRTWNELGWLGKEYGIFTVSCECYGEIYGNLSVGGVETTDNAVVLLDETLGNTCALTFKRSAYGAVRADLAARYGEPRTTADDDPVLAWTLREAEIRLVCPDEGDLSSPENARTHPCLPSRYRKQWLLLLRPYKRHS